MNAEVSKTSSFVLRRNIPVLFTWLCNTGLAHSDKIYIAKADILI